MNTETVTESVTADQLSIGDRVLAFGLEWTVHSVLVEVVGMNLTNSVSGCSCVVLNNGSTFERIIPPKRYKRTEVLEYRVPVEGEVFHHDCHDVRSFEASASHANNPYRRKAYVITSVEVTEL